MIPYKPKIFVSSTIKDMPNERIAALKAINEFGAEPVMSEYTISAQNSNSISVCLDSVKNSHIYVLILGGKFGWQPFGKESITELEYNTAQTNNVPTLVFNTHYRKDDLQTEFSDKVGATYFWKTIDDVFQLKEELTKSLKIEIEKLQKNQINNTEPIYSNLINISFPEKLYIADLNLDRDEIIQNSKSTRKWLSKNASWFDIAVSAIHQRGIIFPHDWTIYKKQILTFHNLSDSDVALSKICDLGTVTPLYCSEFYNQSLDQLSVFKTLLAKCLQTKLYRLNIKWYKDEKLFAFLPVSKDSKDRWINRKIEWTKTKRNSRTVTKTTYSLKDPNKISSTRHLAFEAKFYFLNEEWFVAIKPDWLITWKDFEASKYGFEKIQYIKQKEKNIHVFNHLNFILWYLQPDRTLPLFNEYTEYKFLKIESFLKFDAFPIIHDELWRQLESKKNSKNLIDKNGTIDLFIK
ncbi:MAG: DUF4062 domain-containing protein [Ignavibacteriae bacterium]|nr:DUF4062 domain-containing protein [Ignavibacteriota bacterium]NOG99289.1 DUF4062 domain-containing protein [Ignavibacteriota bacterium]